MEGHVNSSRDIPEISVVLPVYNEQAGLPELHRRVAEVLVGQGWSYEIILVNDGSRDGSWQRIQEIANADRAVVGINLSRNFGHQIAITAGVEFSRGQTVVDGFGLAGSAGVDSRAARQVPRRVRCGLRTTPDA